MKKKTMLIVCTIVVAVFLTGQYLVDKMLVVKEYQSPNGNYTLIVKNDRGFFSSTIPGDGGRGSMPVVVVLKDAQGNVIGESDDTCAILYDSLYVEWDLEHDQVWYAKAKSIHLKTGEVGC